eukprot:m.345412 g.345412  ORF g.345412 m.345412 type:complete len:469 (+) comp26286_c0_seq1:110-1516(+)
MSETKSEENAWWETCKTVPEGLLIPQSLADIDTAYMTKLLQARGYISETNKVVSMTETDAGITAGFFSAIKMMSCKFEQDTDAATDFVAKAWPEMEILPKEAIAAMFVRDITAYHFPQDTFYPRVTPLLAAYDLTDNRYGLVLENANTYGEQKECVANPICMDTLKTMIPNMVQAAVAWEGCDQGAAATQLEELHVVHLNDPRNMGIYTASMPTGCRFFDHLLKIKSPMIDGIDTAKLGPKFAETLTTKLISLMEKTNPANGATCTLCHCDVKGDNVFITPNTQEGWMLIDFQLMSKGPVPTDLAYTMVTSVSHEVIADKQQCDNILDMFYTQYMAKTKKYTTYTYEEFVREFKVMSNLINMYVIGMGAALYHAGLANQGNMVEFFDSEESVSTLVQNLCAGDKRKRDWLRSVIINFIALNDHYGITEYIGSLPDSPEGLADFMDIPERLLLLPKKDDSPLVTKLYNL